MFYGDQSNRVVAYVLIPREPLAKRPEFWVCPAEGDLSFERGPLPDLPKALVQLDTRYPVKRE